jgi:hypothetical protein
MGCNAFRKHHITPINTKGLIFSTACLTFKQVLEHHIYLNTKDTLVVINNAAFDMYQCKSCLSELTRQDFRKLFGQPIYADSIAFCYKVKKNEDQNIIYNNGKKIYNGGYITLIILFKGNKADGWLIEKYEGLNPNISVINY